MLNLVIDIGNTRTKAALFKGTDLLVKEIWEHPSVEAVEKMTYNQKVKNVILSSTARVPAPFEDYLKGQFFYIRLDTGTPLPFAVQYATPHTLGKDRLAAAAGAICLFPNEHALIIDAGTCITMDIITSQSVYLGGNISPGITMRLKAMHHFTAKLPLIERSGGKKNQQAAGNSTKNTLPFIGDSTENAMRNGAELGALMEVTAYMEKCRRRFKPLKVLFTGGDADFFVKKIKTKIFATPNLVLAGLNKILNHNVENYLQRKGSQ